MRTKLNWMLVFPAALLTLWGCGSSNNNSTPDGGNGLNATFDPGFTQTSPNKPRSIQVLFSGEVLGVNGLPFQPLHSGDPVFVDGWSVTFQEILVVIGNIRL